MDAKVPSKKELKQVFSKTFLKNLTRDKLIQRLRKLASILGKFDQEPSAVIKDVPESLLQSSLMRSKNQEVQILTAICHSEILRIYAPDPPYKTPALKNVFLLILSQLPGLGKVAGQHYSKYFHLLESLHLTKSHLILNDIDEDEVLKTRLFQTFFDLKQNEVSSQVEFYMGEIMKALLEESEGISQSIFDVILRQLTPAQSDSNPGGCELALSLILKCESILEHPIAQFFKEAILSANEHDSSITDRSDLFEIMHKLSIGTPDIMYPTLAEYAGHLMDEKAEIRLEACEFFGKLFSAKDFVFAAQFQNLVLSYIDRLKDVDAQVRLAVLNTVSDVMSRCEGAALKRLQILLKARIEDTDHEIRAASVKCVIAAATKDPAAVTPELLLKVGGRALDKKLNVRRAALVGMANLFQKYFADKWKAGRPVAKVATRMTWLPTRLVQVGNVDSMMQYFVEGLLDEVVLPECYTPAERMRCLIGVYASFSAESKKVFKKIMNGKKVMHEALGRALEAWKQAKESDDAMANFEFQAKIIAKMIPTPGQNYEGGQIIKDVLKDPNRKVLKILEKMSDPRTDYRVLRISKQEILKLLGLKGQPHLFVKRLVQRLCNTLLPTDGISTLTNEVATHLKKGRKALADAGLRLLEITASCFPSTLFPNVREFISLAVGTSDTYVPSILGILSLLDLQEIERLDSKTLGVKLGPLVKNLDPKIAKLAARSICKAKTSSSEILKLVKSLKGNLTLDAKLPSKLRALGEIAYHKPSIFSSAEAKVTQFVKDNLLRESFSKKDKDFVHSCKIAGVKFLQNYALGFAEPEQVADEKVTLIIKDLMDLLGDEKAEGIEVQIAKTILKLCKVPQYFEKVKEIPDVFCSLAFIVETDITEEFVGYVLKRMATDPKFPFAFFAHLAFSSHLSNEKSKMISIRMRSLILRERRKISLFNDLNKQRNNLLVSQYPEATTAHLIYILSKHPSIENDGPQFKHILKILDFFFDTFCQGNQENNYSLIVNILATIKLHRDRYDDGNVNLYRVAELAHHALKAKFKGKQWKEETHPMQIPLPRWLFKRKKDGTIQGEDQYLPNEFKLTSPSRSRQKKKKEGSGFNNVEDDEEEEYVPGRKASQRRKKRKKKKKVDLEDDYEENVPKNNEPSVTPKRRPRHSRPTRSNTKLMEEDEDRKISALDDENGEDTNTRNTRPTRRSKRVSETSKSPSKRKAGRKRASPAATSPQKSKSQKSKDDLEVEEVTTKRRSRRRKEKPCT